MFGPYESMHPEFGHQRPHPHHHRGRGLGHGYGHGRGRGRGRGRGGRAAKGDLRGVIMYLLSEEPMHGYQLITEIGQRTDGRWTPSPGAIYPTLSLLEDEGLIQLNADSGRKVASLTDAGREFVTARAAELAAILETYRSEPTDEEAFEGAAETWRELHGEMGRLRFAVHQAARAGGEKATRMVEIITRARKEIEELS